MKKQPLLTALLISQIGFMALYTAFAFQHEGPDLFSVFFSNLLALNWSGQFNLDFSFYLVLSGLWMVWRNGLPARSVALAVAAMILGILFFAPYLLYLLGVHQGDLRAVLVGRHAR